MRPDESIADYTPTAPVEDAEPLLSDSERRKLSAFLRRAQALAGPEHDGKLAEAARIVGELLRQGRSPIVFCRFIATARYLESWFRRLLTTEFPYVRVAAVTGEIGDEERRVRVEELAHEPRRILVATDCLSEGVNLQESFDAVLHYDLPWNPNRLEQREGSRRSLRPAQADCSDRIAVRAGESRRPGGSGGAGTQSAHHP